MKVSDRLKRKWRRFRGHNSRPQEDLTKEIASTNAEIAFSLALKHMQSTRGQFDIRPTSDPPPADDPLTDLSLRLTHDDMLMKEAIYGIDSPENEDHDVEDRSGRTEEPD